MFDVLWAVGTYERLVADWDLDREDAIRGITWVIGLVGAAVRDDRGPGGGSSRRRGRAAS